MPEQTLPPTDDAPGDDSRGEDALSDAAAFPLREFLGMSFQPTGQPPDQPPGGHAIAVMEIGAQHLNPNGVAHGAALFALIDTVMGAATVSVLPVGSHCATIEMQTRFLRAVFSGRLTARASVLNAGKRIVHLQGEVRTDDDTLVATATASFAVIPDPNSRPT